MHPAGTLWLVTLRAVRPVLVQRGQAIRVLTFNDVVSAVSDVLD